MPTKPDLNENFSQFFLHLHLGGEGLQAQVFVHQIARIYSFRVVFGNKATIMLSARFVEPEHKYTWSFTGLSWVYRGLDDVRAYLPTIISEIESVINSKAG